MVSVMVGAGVVAVVSLLLSVLFAQAQRDAKRVWDVEAAVGAGWMSGCFSVLFFLAAVVVIVAACLYAFRGVL